jgi:hypothetical protein
MEIVGRVVNMHGEVLANNQADLWDGTIATGVRYSENLTFLPNNTTFWTGSNSFGALSQNAENWQQTVSVSANAGFSQSTTNWFNQTLRNGNGANRLPCLCQASVIDPGDFNDDGVVDAADYTIWRNTLGDTVDRGYFADGDGDGTITEGDYAVWRTNYGKVYAAGGGGLAAVTPEPSTVVMSFVLYAGFIACRRFERR